MKTEQEIISKARLLIPMPKRKDDLDTFSYEDICKIEQNAFVYGYTQAQDDMQAELEAKDAEIEKLKAELQAAKDDAIGFAEWLVRDDNSLFGSEYYSFEELKDLYKQYQQSKTK